jgi:hypothetical protein
MWRTTPITEVYPVVLYAHKRKCSESNNKTQSIYYYVIHMLIAADYNENEDDNNNTITVHNRNIK